MLLIQKEEEEENHKAQTQKQVSMHLYHSSLFISQIPV